MAHMQKEDRISIEKEIHVVGGHSNVNVLQTTEKRDPAIAAGNIMEVINLLGEKGVILKRKTGTDIVATSKRAPRVPAAIPASPHPRDNTK